MCRDEVVLRNSQKFSEILRDFQEFSVLATFNLAISLTGVRGCSHIIM